MARGTFKNTTPRTALSRCTRRPRHHSASAAAGFCRGDLSVSAAPSRTRPPDALKMSPAVRKRAPASTSESDRELKTDGGDRAFSRREPTASRSPRPEGRHLPGGTPQAAAGLRHLARRLEGGTSPPLPPPGAAAPPRLRPRRRGAAGGRRPPAEPRPATRPEGRQPQAAPFSCRLACPHGRTATRVVPPQPPRELARAPPRPLLPRFPPVRSRPRSPTPVSSHPTSRAPGPAGRPPACLPDPPARPGGLTGSTGHIPA